MAESSTSRIVVGMFLLFCAVAGGWIMLSEQGKRTVMDSVREKIAEVAEQPASTAANTEEKNSKLEISAGIHTGPRPREAEPVTADLQQAVHDRVEKAVNNEQSAVAEDGASHGGTLTDTAPEADNLRQDSVVSSDFVKDAARWFALSYQPSRKVGQSGRSSVDLIRANARYSNSATLRSDEHDVIKGRKAILGYVYTPGMLEALYRMYAPHFMLELENAARQPRKNVSLKDDQIADMMSIYAERFLRLSSALDAASSVDIKALAEAIHHASEKEYSANEDFSRAYSAYALSKDAGNQNEAAIQSRRMLESSRQAGMYAAAQDKARQNLAYELRRKAVGQTLQNTELIFLGEWLARHEASAEASRMAADVCRRMAERCSQRARELKNGNAEPTEDLEGKLSASVPTAVPADAIQE